jgi:hypothetical protein
LQHATSTSQKADYDKYKREVRQSVKQLEQGRRASDALHTTLGITHLVAKERKLRAISRVAAWDVVLNEQELQQQLGKRNSILLADLHKSVSANAVGKAQRAAQVVADYAAHTVDDIEVMEPSHNLLVGKNTRRRCNNMDFGNLLAELSLSNSLFDESSLSAANWAEL